MKWAKQRTLSVELNAKFPRGDIRQNLFRCFYYVFRLTGMSITEATDTALLGIREHFGPDFAPVCR